MYSVTIFFHGESIDSRDFAFGTWNEIGFWLDEYGYNDGSYGIKIACIAN